jgi:Ca2+-binding RTX toxin-like protein
MAGLRAIGAVAVVTLVLPATSDAAVVQLHLGNQYDASAASLVVTALPGETNRLSLLRRADGIVEIRDAGAPLYPGSNCTGGGNQVDCAVPLSSTLTVSASAGDGADHVSLESLGRYSYGTVSAGSGEDVVLGGPGHDNLNGSAGNDQLAGGGGNDEFLGGTGADLLRGGPGVDTADYRGHRAPVSVTLDDRPDDGSTGEGDDVGLDVENVRDGRGADRLLGSDGPNTLESDDGADHLSGGAGDDTLIGGYSTASRLTGGPGQDLVMPGRRNTVDVRDGEVDRVRCESGLARPLRADAVDVLKSCVPIARIPAAKARVRGSGRVQLHIRCRAIDQACRLQLELRRADQTLARASLRIDAGRHTRSLTLNARGRLLVARAERLRVNLRLRTVRTAPARSMSPSYTTPLVLERTS